ncbi:sodium:solute symporter [Brevibacillus thermoruber]|jgi:solute:Na+ symporter, SSS family|uniref:Sodium:solute symporter n=1 Tax=Brevibacillus thermoruber TaxID=33942 RepID=A0A9X3TQS4_9BACL|nr:sodium:solute symporter [Brevibacillus thermoruber]MDA5109057.1 sodium:solute symporter [Brevibacillus thermoruber]
MNSVDTIVILLYFASLIAVGVVGSKRARTTEEYALAGRNLGMFMYLGCLSAVILGGASTIGTTKLGYTFGISGMWFVTMIGVGIMLLGVLFTKRISQSNVTTISEFLGKRYNAETRLVSALVAAIYTLMVAVTQVIGMGTIINVLLGWDMTLSMIVGGGIVLFYTILGGMWSVTVTDIIQFIVMTAGVFLIMLPMSLSHVGGWDQLASRLPAAHFDLTAIGGGQILQYFLLYALGMVVSQDIWQRVFTARTLQISRTGSVLAGVYSILYAVSLTIVGMCAFIALPHLENPQNAFANMAISILPNGVLGIVLASVCSALMSTASGTLLASSTLLTHDILKPYWFRDMDDRRLLRLSRVTTLFIGALAIVFSIWIQDVLVALDVAYAILSGAIFVPLVVGYFWKRATAKAAFSSIIAGTVVVLAGLAIEGLSSTNPIMYGIAVSLAVMIGMTYATAPSVSDNVHSVK